MTLAKCLADAVADGRLTREQADDAQARVADIMATRGMAETEAMAEAAAQIAKAAADHKRRTALRIIAAEGRVADARSHPRGFSAGVAAIFGRDAYGLAGYSNIEGRTKAIRGEAHARLTALLDAYRSKTLGLTRDVPGLTRFIRALYGQDNDATGFARAWRETTDWMVQRFNRAGGTLPAKHNWNLPQIWVKEAVQARGRAAFIDDMRARIEAGELRIADWEDGKPIPPERTAAMLGRAYDRITTEGLVDMVPGQVGRASTAARHNQPRMFEWTGPDAWLRFNRDYGVGDAGIFDLVVDHIDGMARDTAMLEILGPNPHHMARYLIDTARKEGAGPYAAHKLAAIWDQVSGAAASPVNQMAATMMAGVRSWLTSAQLGSAVLSSVTDFSTIKAAATWNGLPATGVIRRYVGLLAPHNMEDRQLAVRLGLIADGWAQRAQAANRTQVEVVGRDLPGRVADTVMRASGMNAHTTAAKWAFGMEFLGHLADRAGRELDELEPELQRAFRTYGITAEDWDVIRARGVWEEDGARFIYPEQIVRGVPGDAADMAMPEHQLAASRLLEMVQTETGFAVVEPGALERALLLGRTQAGTFAGEIIRSAAQYKTFPVSVLTRHAMRGMESFRAGDHGRYAAALAVSLTLTGALASQMKDIARGRDPRDMTDWKFWGAAFMQGGGAGILGDFLYGAVNRADRGFYMAMMGGPVGGLVDDAMRLTGGNIQGLAADKDTHFGAELARFVQRNTPGTTLWYSRLAVDRLLWDRLHEVAGQDAQRRWARDENRLLRETSQQLWWRPGDTSPARAPDIPAALGGRP